VRLVCAVRVPLCVRVSRVYVPAPPGVFLPVQLCVSRLPPVSFYRYSYLCARVPLCVPAPPGVFLPVQLLNMELARVWVRSMQFVLVASGICTALAWHPASAQQAIVRGWAACRR
jgi:hypothetical protein